MVQQLNYYNRLYRKTSLKCIQLRISQIGTIDVPLKIIQEKCVQTHSKTSTDMNDFNARNIFGNENFDRRPQ